MTNTALAQPAVSTQGKMLLLMKAAADKANNELAVVRNEITVIDPIAGDAEAINRLKVACMAYCSTCPLSVCRFD